MKLPGDIHVFPFMRNLGAKLLHPPGWLLFPLAVIIFSAFYVPWLPYHIFSKGLDASWIEALHYAFETKKQFGSEIVFTYGPLGFLAFWMYIPTTYHWIFIIHTLLFILYSEACWHLIRQQIFNAWACFFIFAGVFITSFPPHENFFSTACFLTFLVFYFSNNSFSFRNFLLTLALALISLIKVSYLFMVLPIVLMSVCQSLFSRRIPWIGLCFLFFFLLFWKLAGQEFSHLPSYFLNSKEIISGYAETMAHPKAPHLPLPGILYLFNGALLIFAAAISCKNFSPYGRLSLPLLLAWFLFLNFKICFVRMDFMHLKSGFLAALAIGFLCFPFFWKQSTRFLWRFFIILLLVSSTTLVGTTFKSAGSFLKEGVSAFSSLPTQFSLVRKINFSNLHQDRVRDIVDEFPVPTNLGSVDSYAIELSFIFAHRLNYRPRPTIQSYVAYTEKLAELNAAHLRGPSAPDSIFFEFPRCTGECIESFFDTLSWPEIATRYVPKAMAKDIILLKKVSSPLSYSLKPVSSVKTNWGTMIPIPEASSGKVWVKIQVQPRIRNKLLSFFYKPVPVKMRLKNQAGTIQDVYFSPSLIKGGFLLSPLVRNVHDFNKAFYLPGQFPSDLIVSELGIVAEKGFEAKKFFHEEIEISFFELQIK